MKINIYATLRDLANEEPTVAYICKDTSLQNGLLQILLEDNTTIGISTVGLIYTFEN